MDRDADPTSFSAIAATTTTATADSSDNEESDRSSPVARPSTATGHGRFRWVVERTFAWLHQFRRLLVRYERRAEIHKAFLAIGCCLICWRRLGQSTNWNDSKRKAPVPDQEQTGRKVRPGAMVRRRRVGSSPCR
jgi:Transposase DDE domain